MAVHNITLQLSTGRDQGAGTDGDVYLGIGGREFYLDAGPRGAGAAEIDDFERYTMDVYFLGHFRPGVDPADSVNHRVREPNFNDPSSPQMLEEDILRHPVYIRFRGTGRDDVWQVAGAVVSVGHDGRTPDGLRELVPQFRLRMQNIWLGTRRGEMVTLVADNV